MTKTRSGLRRCPHDAAQANIKPVRSVDLTGEVCPMTFVKVKLHLEQLKSGEALEVILKEGDHMKNVPRSVKDEGHRIVEVNSLEDGRHRLLIVKGGGEGGQEGEGVTGYVKGLKCMEADCGREYPKEPRHICEFCFGKLQVDYDYDAVAETMTREVIESREPSMWRYRELLPVDIEPTVGHEVGFTPLVRARNLGRALGHDKVYVKNDAVNFPTLSFKDRVVSVAVAKAKEFGFDTVACATTGNLGNALAAQARRAGVDCFIFMPADLEQGKIVGTSIYGVNVVGISGNYDGVNRLCTEIADRYGWAFVNINIRPYYAEGSKSFGFEILEQLGWRAPRHVVVPMAGGSLITKIEKAIREFVKLGLVKDVGTKVHGAQATGCNPISAAVKAGEEIFTPVKPDTIAHSIAIGNPADGYYAIETIRRTGGWAEDATDEEIVEGMRLLAETEGIFTETAGGVTVAVARKLIEQGRIPGDESLVVSITGNGLKTQEALGGALRERAIIEAKLDEFDTLAGRLGFAAKGE